MKRLLPSLLLISLCLTTPAFADDDHRFKPDDSVVFSLSAEDWVTTKTARVIIAVEAAVSDKNTGSMRTDMMKSVEGLTKTDWRLTSFNRSMEQTGLERWSTTYEARVEENELNGLAENAKRASKAGMQLSVNDIDFSPTLDEMEAAKAALRTKIYEMANDQVTSLNSTLPGRNYRIATVNFFPESGIPIPMAPRGVMMKASSMMAAAPALSEGATERSQKISLTAQIVLAAVPPAVK